MGLERTFAWLHQFKRLLVRYERRADIHVALLGLACRLVCWRRLRCVRRVEGAGAQGVMLRM